MKHTLTSVQEELSAIEARYPDITDAEGRRAKYLGRKFKQLLRDDSPPVPFRRGGPRPGFGGKQPGAGRKPTPVGDKPIQVNVILEPDLCRKLDALRGKVSRAEWIRRLLDSYSTNVAASRPTPTTSSSLLDAPTTSPAAP